MFLSLAAAATACAAILVDVGRRYFAARSLSGLSTKMSDFMRVSSISQPDGLRFSKMTAHAFRSTVSVLVSNLGGRPSYVGSKENGPSSSDHSSSELAFVVRRARAFCMAR